MCPILALGVDGGTVALDDSVLPVLVCHSDRVGGAAKGLLVLSGSVCDPTFVVLEHGLGQLLGGDQVEFVVVLFAVEEMVIVSKVCTEKCGRARKLRVRKV